MAWFKVDDGLWGSPKWIGISPSARALWVTAGSWSMNQLTGGKVPRHVLSTLGGRPKDAAELLASGLWEPHPEGWIFHDWHDYQPTREKVLAERAAAKERQRKAREAAKSRRESQRDSDVTADVTSGVTSADVTVPPTRPDPTPSLTALGGERTETLRIVPATQPAQKQDAVCSRHPDGNPNDEPCGGCKRVNEREARKAAREDEKLQREIERAGLDCDECDGTWVVDPDTKLPTRRRCDHRRTA